MHLAGSLTSCRTRLAPPLSRSLISGRSQEDSLCPRFRVFGEETPTDGYHLLKLFAAYSFGTNRVVNTITARVENATDRLYRNHLSLIKDFVPEMGRNFKLVYSIRF